MSKVAQSTIIKLSFKLCCKSGPVCEIWLEENVCSEEKVVITFQESTFLNENTKISYLALQ